jgi:hypothetical protein
MENRYRLGTKTHNSFGFDSANLALSSQQNSQNGLEIIPHQTHAKIKSRQLAILALFMVNYNLSFAGTDSQKGDCNGSRPKLRNISIPLDLFIKKSKSLRASSSAVFLCIHYAFELAQLMQ